MSTNTAQTTSSVTSASTTTSFNVKEEYLTVFHDAIREFVSALRKKYKKDSQIQEAYQKFDFMFTNLDAPGKSILLKKMITTWYKLFHPIISDVNQGKFTCVTNCNHPLFSELNLKQKFQHAKLSTKKIILMHIKNISQACELYHCTAQVEADLPSSIINKIAKMSQQITNNGSNQPDINAIFSMSQNLVKTMSKQEIESLQKLGKSGSIQSLFSQFLQQ